MLNKEFSRKTFVKGGGALIVGFGLAGASLGGKAQAGLFTSPDPAVIDAWITVHADNTVSIKTGKDEFGQGSETGLLQIAGEELDMDLTQLKFVQSDTYLTPNTGSTSASRSIRQGGPLLRAAAVSARQELLKLASVSLGVPVASLTVKSGVVSGGGKSVKYGDLIGDKLFNVTIPASYGVTAATATVSAAEKPGGPGLRPGEPGTKPVSQYRLVGTRVPRIDIPAQVAGTYVYLHNVRVPGMLHGRVVRPRGRGAYGTGAPIVSLDESSIKHIPGARVVRKGDFLGVVAAEEYHAIQAAAQLKVTWRESSLLSGSGNIVKQMRGHDSSGMAPARITDSAGNVGNALASAAHVVSRSFSFAYNSHGVIGPTCCVADVQPTSAVVLSNTENVYSLRGKLARALALQEDSIRVRFVPGNSGYGDDPPYDDTALSAALMSQIVGKPVRLQFMRWDEFGWGHYTPFWLTDVRGGIDATGKLVGLDVTTFGIPYSNKSTETAAELAGQPIGLPSASGPGGGWTRHVGAIQYTLPNKLMTTKVMPLLNNYFSTGFMRGPGGLQSVFAVEQVIDELAHAANMDPVEFRRRNVSSIDTDRWLGVLNAAAQAANWKPKVAASNLSKADVVTGRGIALAAGDQGAHPQGTYGAVVADIEVNKKTGKIVVKHLYAAQDSGLAINPALLENQVIGMVIQATSRAFEGIVFNKSRVTSLDWVTYPIMRFKEHPSVTAIVLNRPDVPPNGGGQEVHPHPPAAIANAFFDATGVRIQQVPMTPARVRAVLKAAGVT
jgi:CO/xanthine dehydrogenase Mo-binding subunit